MKYVFAPGCALLLYKPGLSEKVHAFLNKDLGEMDVFLTCCHHEDGLPDGTVIINTCSGCSKRYKNRREGLGTVSLWEVLADSKSFDFPDYNGATMTVHDACPTRDNEKLHAAVRKLLNRMNINVVEPEFTGTNQKCCGDSLYPSKPAEVIYEKMKERASQMPAEDVCVYCVSCVKSMKNGGKSPRYLIDLLFGEKTEPGDCDVLKWHAEVEAFIEAH